MNLLFVIFSLPFKILYAIVHWKEFFCRHDWETKIYPPAMGMFGGAKTRTCKKCGKIDDSESWARLKKLNDSYKYMVNR